MATAPQIVALPAGGTPPQLEPTNRYRRRKPKPGEESLLSRDEWSLNKPVKGSLFRTLLRLVQILGVASYFIIRAVFGSVIIRGQHRRRELRAVFLRRALEVLGGAFIKIGQQLSLRRDMLAVEYCDALKELLDNVKEFDFEHARKAIEAQIRGPIESVFTGLDPNPIGKASVACVYQAWLCDQHEREPVRVAIKVRRPGIVELFAADLRALDWIMGSVEYFTIIRAGVSRTFRDQLKEIFFDELDFRVEARYQELFRRQYKRHRGYRVTAPRVFHRYSGKAVMVSEYVDAIPLESITSAVESGDEEYLGYLRSLHIHPIRLAKRLIRYNFHAFFEDVFFHGDPHPANIRVRSRNRLVFIDFGACGTFSKRDRHMMLHMHYAHSRKDIRGMVESVIALMEPLPPIDVDEFRRKLEKQYWDGYYGLLSKHADWRDRTSYRLWVALFDLVREYHIPMPLNMLRMIRATLLYDTIAAQLYNRIDVFREFRKYERTYAQRLQVQAFRDATRQALCGPDLHWYLSFHRLFEMGRTALFRLLKFLDEPGFSIAAITNKLYFAIAIGTRWLTSVFVVSVVFTTLIFWMYRVGLKVPEQTDRKPDQKVELVVAENKEEFEVVRYWPTVGHFLNPLNWDEFMNLPRSGDRKDRAETTYTTMWAFYVVLVVITFVHINALRLRFRDPDL